MRAFAIFLVCLLALNARAELQLVRTIPLPNVEGRIDHMAVDAAGQRLFVAALGNNTVEVVDLKAGKKTQSFFGFTEPQGIVYVPEFNKLFVANGADGSVRVLDDHSFKTIGTVQLGDDADNARYDEKAKVVYVGYGDGALAAIDAKTGTKVADIKLAAHPESFRLETGGSRIFVNVPGADQIDVVDRQKDSVIQTWPLKGAKANFPMILDETDHRLFVGCRSPAKVLIYDTSGSNHLVASVPISRDVDDLFYDARNKLLYASCGAGNLEVIKQLAANNYKKLELIPTAPGARTSLFIPALKMFCLAVPHRGIQNAELWIYRLKQ
ncbi:MAG TPA: YncE family protein [Verrucomicrobiae bacterium]|nr:YncE family protein [Verrucomicrobiae bacterium]